jgi:uncharacterized protein YqeY
LPEKERKKEDFMDKRAEFNTALKDALKNKEQVAVATIRLILAALKDKDISARGEGKPEGISEPEILSMLQSMVKQREESAKTYADAGRDDLALREQQEIEVIRRFLPQQMSEKELAAALDALINEMGASDIKDMGRVMAELKTRFAGQVDMGKASGMVKQKLAA